MDFQREFIEMGSIRIQYYGLIIVLGMLVATFVAVSLASRGKRDSEHVYGALTWAIIPGIVFSRLWFIIFPPVSLCQPNATICRDTAWFFENFFNTTDGAIAIWSGGLSIFGALLGGLLGMYIYLRKNKLVVPAWLDIAAVVLPLGQAIGRWANYVNQEVYGSPTDFPWGIEILRENLIEKYRAIDYFGESFHPVFLYESLWSLVAFYVLFRLYKNSRDRFHPGDFVLIYVAQYAFIRFMLEFIWADVTMVGDINLYQLLSAIAFVAAAGMLVYRHRGEVEIVPYDQAAPPEPPTSKKSKKDKAIDEESLETEDEVETTPESETTESV
jgi:phosphatidylglycerol---prolipoprotein diacylglyceryl transferase